MKATLDRAPRASARRMLVVGLDAADSTLIEKWCDEGVLPTLAFLRKEGAWIPLAQDRPIPSASVWPSIYTGTHPGKHGIYNSVQMGPGQQKVNRINPSRCSQPPLWRTLDSNGKHSIIMDVPFNYPLKNFNGTQILDWGTYERHYESHSLPGEVLSEISQRFSRYPFGAEMSRDAPSSVRDFSRARAQLLAGAALKGDVVKWLMSNRPWDFFMAVFSETHPAGHYFWGFHSNGQHGYFPELATTIKDVYRAVDEQLGKIIEGLDESITLLVLSGQGMGANAAQWHIIPEVLSKLGFLVTKTKNDQRSVTQTHWLGEMRDSVPLNWRRSVSRHLPDTLRDQLRSYWATSRIDWSQTRAFNLPTDLLGYIRINLKGREPQGLVEPGSEYDHVCVEISEALKEVVDRKTGAHIVRDVFYTDQIFPGPQRDRLPDLIVTWPDEYNSDEVYSEEIGSIRGSLPDPRSGNHKPQGFAIFYGPGIRKGCITEGHIVDVAPTVLQYFGLKPPSDIDGRPWANIFS